MSPEVLASAITTHATDVAECKESAKEKCDDLSMEVIDGLIASLKNGAVTDLGTERSVVAAINAHPHKEKLIGILRGKRGIEFETAIDPETSEIRILGIKGDEDDVFDIDELEGSDKTTEVYSGLAEQGIDIAEENEGVQALVKRNIEEFLEQGIPPQILTQLISIRLGDYRKEVERESNKSKLQKQDKELDTKIPEQGKQEKELDTNNSEQGKQEQGVDKETAEKDGIIKASLNEIGGKNLSELKQVAIEVGENTLTKKPLSSEVQEELLIKVNTIIANIESIKKDILRPEEQHLIDNAVINVAGSSQAEIYADVFAKIDAGVKDEDRKKVLQEQVAEKLGIKLPTERPANATELKGQLSMLKEAKAEGRVDEKGKPVAFDKEHPFIMNVSPMITVYPKGNNEYVCEGHVANMPQPVSLDFDGDTPSADLNNAMNNLFIKAVFSNHQNAGVINAIKGVGTNLDGTTQQNIQEKALGDSDIMEHVTRMFLGHTTVKGGRFLKTSELHSMQENMRWLVPDGNMGLFNQIDPHQAKSLVKDGLGMDATSRGKDNMVLAGMHFQGKLGSPTYQGLYNMMYPKDKAAGYKRLREKVGDALVDRYFGSEEKAVE